MGVRIAFYKTTDGKSLVANFNRTFADFRTWILTENELSLKDYNEQIIRDNIATFLVNMQNEKTISIQNTPQHIIDELICEYVLTYCDRGKGQTNLELIGPLISKHRYTTSFTLIENTKDTKLIALWNYLKVGRSLRQDSNFTDLEFNKIGFWNKDEMTYIKQTIKAITTDDIGISCIASVLEEVGETAELLFNIEL